MSSFWNFFEKGSGGILKGKGGVELAFRSFDSKKKQARSQAPALIILPGRAEPIHKYAEVIYDLRDLGFSIHILEHRGQGESGLIDGCKNQYVENYQDYVDDLDTFIRSIVARKKYSKLFLLAHSMGGLIGSLYASQHPKRFNAIALSAPMFDVNTKGLSMNSAQCLAQFLCCIGLGKWSDPTGSANRRVTSSKTRAKMNDQVTLRYSNIEAGKVSFRWIMASLRAVEQIQSEASKIKVPVLLLQAGIDLLIPQKGQNDFCEKVQGSEKILFPKAYHEILMEVDSIRNPAIEKIKKFFLKHLP